MSRDWTKEELQAASEFMKAAGYMSFEEFCEELKRQEKLIVELCPECGAENAIAWYIEDAGYKAYCPHCGTPMMLCSMCDREPCDWTEEDRCKHNRKTAPVAAGNELQQPPSSERE